MLTILLTLVSAFVIITSIGRGLSTINPGYHDFDLVYPLSEATNNVIWTLTLITVPIGLALVTIAGINFKLRILNLSRLLIFISILLFCWLIFVSWAFNPRLTPENNENPTGDQRDGTLRQKSLNFD